MQNTHTHTPTSICSNRSWKGCGRCSTTTHLRLHAFILEVHGPQRLCCGSCLPRVATWWAVIPTPNPNPLRLPVEYRTVYIVRFSVSSIAEWNGLTLLFVVGSHFPDSKHHYRPFFAREMMSPPSHITPKFKKKKLHFLESKKGKVNKIQNVLFSKSLHSRLLLLAPR